METPKETATEAPPPDRREPPPGGHLPDFFRQDHKQLPLWRKVLYLSGGLVAVALGVIGWLLPVITGIPFYIIGLVLLGLASARARRLINWMERKLPTSVRRPLRRFLARHGSSRLREMVNLPEAGEDGML